MYISIHALLAESDRVAAVVLVGDLDISIHALLAESDATNPASVAREIKFLSTLSLRRATISFTADTLMDTNFYPRSPCGERPVLLNEGAADDEISIHALLAESDAPQERSYSI